ncbi:MAG TPA: hypothetical protein IAC41_07175 [Candidatus Merdenecus merdavium]|nr:hypothetical protein [Candidatus Merdenecus merdavium]
MNNQWIIIILLLFCGFGNSNQCCEERGSGGDRCTEPPCGCGSVGSVRCNICGFNPCRCRRVRACEEVQTCETTDVQDEAFTEEPVTYLDDSNSLYLDSQGQYRPEIPVRSDYIQRHNYKNYRQ